MSAQTRSEIVDLLQRHQVTPSHRLGQHFLADGNITRKIVTLSGVSNGSQVIEVGAGTGTLTQTLADRGATVVAYEIDRGMRPVLEEATRGLDVDLRFEDVMKADLSEALGVGEWTMVANLPYNVGTPLVLDVLRHHPQVIRLVVMIQSEVADRFVAVPGSDTYGLPSVVVAMHATGRVAIRVPPQVFIPPPRVESAVVVLDRVPAPEGSERAIEMASVAFGQRRKMLRKSLQRVLADPTATLERVGIDPEARAEELSAFDYLRIVEG